MRLLEEKRTEMQDNIRAQRDASEGIRSRRSCDVIIDSAVLAVAKEAPDYTAENADQLYTAVKMKIDAQLASKPDKGWALGE